MGITLLTGIMALIGLILLGKGLKNTVQDIFMTKPGKKVLYTIEDQYPEKGSTGYALISTILFVVDVVITIGLPIVAGSMLDPYSGPFIGASVGILITIWRIRARRKFERELRARKASRKIA